MALQSANNIIGELMHLDRETVYAFVVSLPNQYKHWWLSLYRDAPLHVYIETALVLFILWLLFIRRTVDPAKISESKKFSEKEVKWLVETWEPEPLVPDVDTRGQRRVNASRTVSNII
jgi:hypothetical protein